MDGGADMRCDVDGLDDLIKSISSMADEDITDELLDAGAGELEDEWKQEITRRGYVATGAMRDNVARKKNPKKKNVEVYPAGKDKNGVKNATKAYVLHHGRKSNPKTGGGAIKATYFVNDIQEKGGARAHAAMQQVLDKKLKEKGL